MNRNRLLVAAVVIGLGALLPAGAQAQTQASLAISANVAANCTISTAPVAFGAYDPLVANLAAAKDATGGVRVTCTKGSVPTIGLDAGSHAAGAVRRMVGDTGDFLTYELYQPDGYTTVWGTGTAAYKGPAAPDRTMRTFAVNGRIPGNQEVGTGNYSDSVLATVNF
jgi:spore coat protein U-like protein